MAKYTTTPFGTKSAGDRVSPNKTQVALTYDILAEGEIEGLEDGLASVFLNDIPIIDKLANNIVKLRRATVNTTANNTTVTSSVFGEIGALSHNNLTGMSLGSRQILIEGAKAKTTIASGTAGATTITTSSSFFTSAMLVQLNNAALGGFIRIEGAGQDGSTLVTTGQFVSATQITINEPIATTVSNTTLHIDLVTSIASISGNNATLSQAPGVSTTGSPVLITGANITNTKLKSLFNVDNLQFGLRTGTITQSPLIIDSDFGQSSVISSPGIEMLQNNLRANIGTTGNLSSGYNNELDEPSQTEGTAGDTILTSAFLGVSNPSEVDEVHLNFTFPSCHAVKSSGAKGPSFVELQIFFEYSTDGGSSYVSELAFGPSNNDILTRPDGPGGTNITKFVSKGGTGYNNGYIKPSSAQYTSFSEEFVINTEQFQPYDNWKIKIRRINDINFKDGSFKHTNPCTLSTVESIVKDKLSYPHTAYSAVSFNAKDFNSQLPERAYTLKGMKIQVPTNYKTREETGGAAAYTRNISTGATTSTYQNWDGNFRGDKVTFNPTSINHEKIYCDNPVWVFYDLLTNERYGIGQFIDKSQIDIYELFRIAKYCDEQVPDGEGGTEPRFTCNVYLGKAGEATKVLKQFTSIFRGIGLWADGNLTLSVDRPKQPVYAFSKANTIGGQFTYEGTGDRVRTNQIKVTWNDPDDSYKQSTEYVEDYESIADTGRIVRAEALAFGCTSRGQAHRLGKWRLLSEQNEQETVSFSTSINATGLKPGDIILVQDSDRDRSSYSGRVSNSGTRSTTVIPLDRTISLPAYNSGFKHELHLIYPSGGAYLQDEFAVVGGTTFFEGDLLASITTSTAAANAKDDSNNSIDVVWSENVRVEKQKVNTAAGNVSSLTVNSAFTSTPNAEVMWALKLYNTDGTEKTGTAKEYKIVSVKEEDELQFDIVGAAYHRNKFFEIERGFNLNPRPIKTAPDPEDVIPAPENLVINISPEDSSLDTGTTIGNVTGYNATITWDYPLNSDGSKFKFCNGFEIEHNLSSEVKVVSVGSSEQAIKVSGVSAGDYVIRIRTKSSIGTVSTYLQREITITERELLPPTKSRLELVQQGGEVNRTISMAANGTFSIGNSSYTMTSPDGQLFTNSSSTAATFQQAFAGMGANATAFLLFDASESTDKLKAVQVHTDIASTPSVDYIKEVGASNNGVTAGNGTIQINQFSNQINGTGTSFESDFEAGDLFRIDGGTSTTRTTSGSVTESTTITLSSANSSIKVGQTITGTGIVGASHVKSISNTTLTLSNKQTVGNGVTLTFAPLITYARVRFVETNTLLFLDEIVQRPYTGAGYFKQSFIPDTNNDFILAKITTNVSTAYSIAEQFVTAAPEDSPQFVKGNVYFDSWNGVSALPSTPSASAYNFATKSLTALTANWSLGRALAPYAVASFTFREGDGSVTFDTVRGVSKWNRLPPDAFELSIDDTNRRIKIQLDNTDASLDVVTDSSQLFNDRITTNADGTINYDGSTAVAPNINSMPDAGNTKTGAARGFAGLDSSGDVTRAVPVGVGGTGQTNTNKFLNSGIGISQGINGVFTLDKGDGGSDTTTITKSLLNLDYFDGANKAEFDDATGTDGVFGLKLNNAGTFTNIEVLDSTSRTRFGRLRAGTDPIDGTKSIRNTGITLSADGNLSGGGTSSQINIDSVTGVTNFKSRVETGLTDTGVLDTTVPVSKGGTGQINTNKFLNSGIAINQGNSGLFTLTKGDGTTDTTSITKSKLGLSYDDGATVGAVAGSNLKDSGGSTLSDVDVRNSDLDIDTSGTSIRIKKGTSIIQSTTLDKASVGLTNLNSLETGSGTKLGGIASGATVGATVGTNFFKSGTTTNYTTNEFQNDGITISQGNNGELTLGRGGFANDTTTITKAKLGLSYDDGATVGAVLGSNLKAANGTTTLGDDDVKNASLDVAISGNNIKLKIGSTETSTVSATQGLVGLSGVANNADVTSANTSADTSAVSGRAAGTIKDEAITGNSAAVSVSQLASNLADPAGDMVIAGDNITTGTITGSLINAEGLNLVTKGTGEAGVSITHTSSYSNKFVSTVGTGAGMYMGFISVDPTSGSSLRGGYLRVYINDGLGFVRQMQFADLSGSPINYSSSNGIDLSEGEIHTSFGFFYDGTGTLQLSIGGDSNGSSTTSTVRARVVKFGAETPQLSSGNFTAVTNSNTSTVNTSNNLTVSGFSGTSTVTVTGTGSPQISVNGGSFSSSSQTITSGQTIAVKATSASAAGTSVTATVNIGGATTANYTVTTSGTFTISGASFSGGFNFSWNDLFDIY